VSWRLVSTYLALTLVVLAALEIPLAVTYRDRQLDQLEAGLERDGFVLSSFVEDTLNGSANQDLQVIVDNYSAQTAGRAVIVDANGDLLADSDPPAEEATTDGTPRNFLNRPEIAAALDRQVATGTRDSSTLAPDSSTSPSPSPQVSGSTGRCASRTPPTSSTPGCTGTGPCSLRPPSSPSP
jgi:hypothetical protein